MKRRAVLRDVEVPVSLLVQCGDVHAEIEEVPDAIRVRRPGELREQRASLCQDFAYEPGFVLGE